MMNLYNTHEVKNQPTELTNSNLFMSDGVLNHYLDFHEIDWATPILEQFGQKVGSEEVMTWAVQANENQPVLKTHNRFGERIDEVEYHPAWHQLMNLSVENGLHSMPWSETKSGAHVVRTVLHYMMSQVEVGHICPITMTFAVFPALQLQPEVAQQWLPQILSRDYDPRFINPQQKKGLICGMAMTEKQGGTDVRANSTVAKPIGKQGAGQEYLLTGHKWFCSAPMSDFFLMLAQAPKGLSCFMVPRFQPDGQRNHFFIQRLKNKMGNKSNASSEIELLDTWGIMIGEEGQGIATIINMVSHTRFDCAVASAAFMRQNITQALHFTRQRQAFGKKLFQHSLMKNVLADLALEAEASLALVLRLAQAYDAGDHDESEVAFRRIGTAIAKYWNCKRAPFHTFEAMECLGGSGYVEESIMPRLYREAPLYSIWEGCGNVNCLDVLRAMKREPQTLPVLFAELEKSKGQQPLFDKFLQHLHTAMKTTQDFELEARRLVESFAKALQAALLIRQAPDFVAEAFCQTRLAHEGGLAYGTLPPSVNFDGIISRC